MNSIVLATVARFHFTLLLLFSLFLLWRGHNEPGGGFAAGLTAASAFILYAIAFDAAAARQALRFDSSFLISAGLALAILAGVAGLLAGEPFLAGQWVTLDMPGFGEAKLGTPLLFDVGVYLVVLGVTLTIILPLTEI